MADSTQVHPVAWATAWRRRSPQIAVIVMSWNKQTWETSFMPDFGQLTLNFTTELVEPVNGASVPEPASLALVGVALAGLGLRRRR